jgi:biopolymer transport protein ExbB
MLDIFISGGPLMYLILSCSVIGWTIFLERLISYSRVQRNTTRLGEQVIDCLEKKQFDQAAELACSISSPLARIIQVVFKKKEKSRSELKLLTDEVGSREVLALQRYLGLMATIANVAPLLGLLGTVLGMINAFNALAMEGIGTPATLGSGISQALITTAAGLSVAVPIILVHRYLSSRAEWLTLQLEETTSRILDLLER